LIIAARLPPSAIPLNRENAMRLPTLSAVRELDFIESLKSEGMTHQCRVKSVNAIVTRGRHHTCAQMLFQRWTLRAPFSWLSRSWRPVKRESSLSKFLSHHYDRYPRLVRSAALRSLPAFSCPVSTGDRQECGLEGQVLLGCINYSYDHAPSTRGRGHG
jgi:hypothetical protein